MTSAVPNRRTDRPLRVAVSALTYRRPDLLPRLLTGLARLEVPPGCELLVIIVDNDPDGSAQTQVIADGMPWPVRYAHEPRRGIPVARNRAMAEAKAAGADLLCFVDDDEVPDADWLARLVATWRRTGAHLIGGPVEVLDAPAGATPWQRFVNASLAARMRRKNRRTAAAAATGGRFTVVTNNWLGELAWLVGQDLAFDETLLVTGGSDTRFHADAKRSGARTAWAADAVVREAMPLDRLTLRYQMKRGAMQSMQNFRLAAPRITLRVVAETTLMAPLRLLSGVLLLVIPIYGLASPVVAVRSIGWAIGRVAALFGARSALYS
jgi:succinoglycan biosynthesis protein ExoM